MNIAISAAELSSLINSETDLLIVDCRFTLNDTDAGYQAYKAGHIPGAQYLHLDRDLSSPVQTHGGRHPLPEQEKLQSRLRELGATERTKIICYDAHKGAYACRAWWLLRYFGHQEVAVLNGGWNAWLASYPDKTEPHIRPTAVQSSQHTNAPITLKAGHLLTHSIEMVLNLKGAACLVDSREAPRFHGEIEPIDPIAGHIPGAINLPWQSATDASGFFLHSEAAKIRLAPLGNSIKEATVYCGSGVTACVNIFAMAQMGITATLYPGSWSDWCSYVTAENVSARVATQTATEPKT